MRHRCRSPPTRARQHERITLGSDNPEHADLEVSPPDIAPQFKPSTPPAAKEATPPAKKKRKQRVGRQGDILDDLLQQLQRVNNQPTSDIHRTILKRWPTDSRIKPPSCDTVARHLGRRKD